MFGNNGMAADNTYKGPPSLVLIIWVDDVRHTEDSKEVTVFIKKNSDVKEKFTLNSGELYALALEEIQMVQASCEGETLITCTITS